jgi:ABC-type dipeptide/oligopeptide/nickel transport system permease component
MAKYLGRRVLQAIGVVFGVLTLVFVLIQLTGDPITMMVPGDLSAEDLARMKATFGLDQPLPVQYVKFMTNAFTGDFGLSFRYQLPAMGTVLERLPATIELGLTALAVGVIAGVLLGVIAATRRNTWLDNATMMLALIGQAVPHFWLGIMLALLFAVELQLLPTTGYGGWRYLILPAFTLALGPMARFARLTRSSMLEVLSQDFVRTARAMGFPERIVTYRYALKNALITPLTMVGLEVGTLLGGSVVVETIYAWPGIGRLVVQAILARDFPVVLSVVFLVAVTYVVTNLLVDLFYSFVDPRVTFNEET